MAVTNKRRWRWSSKGIFGPKASSSQPTMNRVSAEDAARITNPSALTGRLFGSQCSHDEHSAFKLPSKKHSKSSKLLSTIGLQQNSGRGSKPFNSTVTGKASGSHQSDEPLNQACMQDTATTLDKSGVQPSASTHNHIDTYGDLDHPFLVIERNSVSPSDRDNGSNAHLELATITTSSQNPPKSHRQNFPNQGLAHQMSHKLSQTFGNPTIVHRPNLRVKSSLVSWQAPSLPTTEVEKRAEKSWHDSTAPSTLNYSGSVSATDPSTSKTSLESSPDIPRLVKIHENKDVNMELKANQPEGVPRDKTLTPIQEVPNPITPTFITVETTANAKIFFETYFNSLFAGRSTSRSVRRRDLELYCEALAIPEDQRQAVRWAWNIQESDHLRQSRILKTRSNRSPTDAGVAVAGYEVVRILGKGSFGVVRLVREKKAAANEDSRYVSSQELKHHTLQGENVSLKIKDNKTLRSSLGVQVAAQRQITGQSFQDVYAMKVIRKSDMLRNCQEGHLRAERDFLVAMEKSRWIIPLIASFQDDTNLYLVMEYMVGGDFLGFLFRKDKLKEKQARWYVAEMILCVEETHRARWIHRDIKPDNFLISSSGHLKISDFGLAFDGHWAHDQKYYKNTRTSLMETLGIKVKGDLEDQEDDEKKKPRSSLANILTGWRGDSLPKTAQLDSPNEKESILQWKNRTGKRRMAASVVGTSQYMAPEVIRGDPYDGRCDWWSIGVILYEDNAHSLHFPKERDVERSEKVSFEAMDLINSLLQEKEHRLSSNKYKINDWQQTRYSSGQVVGKRTDPGAEDYPGQFVYLNDACDIKAHPFFDRISWERLHLTRPPWVPQISGNDDTQWFDDEEGAPISDVNETTSQSDMIVVPDTQKNGHDQATRQVRQVDGADAPRDGNCSQSNLFVVADETSRKNEDRAKPRKRPRDRVLRDKEIGRRALEIRKKGAFLGYTYRRPALSTLEGEREKQHNVHRNSIPTFL